MNKVPRWLNRAVWVCFGHMPAARLPADAERCWYCSNARPGDRPASSKAAQEHNKQVRMEVFKTCNLEGCSNPPVLGRMYCSADCRKNYARRRYREKKRMEKTR